MWRFSWLLVWLTVLWLLLWHDLSYANVLSGVVVGAAVLAFARTPLRSSDGATDRARVNPFAAIYLVVYIAYKLVEANLYLAFEIVTPRNRINVGVVAVPLRTDSELAMLVVANMITITPGTVTIEAHGTPPVLYVNVLHLHQIESLRANMLRIEELYIRAFGSRRAREQLAGGFQP